MPLGYKRFLFAREVSGSVVVGGPRGVFVSVDAANKDAALNRLAWAYPTIPRAAWDYLEQLDPEAHTLGAIGEHLPLAIIH